MVSPLRPVAAQDRGEKALLRWARYHQGRHGKDLSVAESLLDLWPASRMQVFMEDVLNVEHGAASPDEGLNARSLVAFLKSEHLQLAQHADDFVASLSQRPAAVGEVELQWLWHLVELGTLRQCGLCMGGGGGGDENKTMQELQTRLQDLGVHVNRFRPQRMLPILVEIVKRLSNWEPDDSAQMEQAVLMFSDLVLPFRVLDLEDLKSVPHPRTFILMLALCVNPLASNSVRLEMSNLSIGGAQLHDNGVPTTPVTSQGQQPQSPFSSPARKASLSSIGAQSAAKYKAQVEHVQAELLQKQEELKELLAELREAEAGLRQTKARADKAEAALTLLKAQHEEKFELLAESNDSLVAELDTVTKINEDKLRAMEEKYRKKSEQLKSSEAETEQAFQMMAVAEVKIKDLEQRLQELLDEQIFWRKEKLELETARDAAVARMTVQTPASEGLQTTLREKEAEIARLAELIVEHEHRISLVDAERKKLAKENAVLEVELSASESMQMERGAREKEMAALVAQLEGELDQEKAAAAQAKKERDEIKTTHEEVVAKTRRLEVDSEIAKTNQKDLTKKLEQMQKRLETSEKKSSSASNLTETKVKLEARIQALEQECSECRKQIGTQGNVEASLKQQGQHLQQELAALTSALASKEAAWQEERRRTLEEQVGKDNEVALLAAKAEQDVKELVEESLRRQADLTQERDAASRKAEDTQKDLAAAEAKWDELQKVERGELKELRSRVARLDEELQRATMELAQWGVKMQELENAAKKEASELRKVADGQLQELQKQHALALTKERTEIARRLSEEHKMEAEKLEAKRKQSEHAREKEMAELSRRLEEASKASSRVSSLEKERDGAIAECKAIAARVREETKQLAAAKSAAESRETDLEAELKTMTEAGQLSAKEIANVKEEVRAAEARWEARLQEATAREREEAGKSVAAAVARVKNEQQQLDLRKRSPSSSSSVWLMWWAVLMACVARLFLAPLLEI